MSSTKETSILRRAKCSYDRAGTCDRPTPTRSPADELRSDGLAAGRGGATRSVRPRSVSSTTFGERVGPTSAVAVAGFLWPRFVRVDGCILIADRYDAEAFTAWKERLNSRAEIEATVNHVHLWDVFGDSHGDVSDEALAFLGEVMCKTWRAAAAEAFPGEPMDVEYSNDSEDYGPTVTMRSRV